jgi:hypothetical protein
VSKVVPFRLTPEANRERLRRWLTRSIDWGAVDPSLSCAVPTFYPEIPPLGLRRPPLLFGCPRDV